MRTIKFRAWDDTGTDVTKHHLALFDLGDEDAGYYSQRGKVMQYTGLTDRNGVEIYEGDIVKDTDDELRTVKWQSMTSYSPNINGEAYDKNDEIEVIGNIYENAELFNK